MNIFLLKSAGITMLFYIVYKIFLEHDTYFKSIRIYLATGILLSFILPFITITKYVLAPQTKLIFYSQNFQNFVNASSETPFNWMGLLSAIYIIGIALSGLYLIFQIVSLVKLLDTKSVKKFKSYIIIETNKNVSPFSFFKYIVYNPTQFSQAEIQQLLKHEETHVLQKHSIDMLLAQLLVCVQWFNPFAWFYKKAITQNLEYIADKEAKFTLTPKNYAYLLLKTTKPNYEMSLANNFYNSLLKKRIMMLHKNHSSRLKQFKLVLILPLLVGFVFAFNTKVVAQHKHDSKSKITKINIDVFAMQFDKDATKADFDNIKSSFKKKFGYAIKIKNLKHNDKNEITGIKITAKKGKNNAQFATNGNTPIQPIKISYQNNPERINIGNTRELHFASKGKGYQYRVKTSIDSDTPLSDDDVEKVFFNNDKDSLHTIKFKGKNSFVFVTDKDKASFGNAVFIDDDGKKTEIIELKGDGKNYTIFKNDSKTIWKDKNGNITKVIEIKADSKPSKILKLSKIIDKDSKDKSKNVKVFVKEIDNDDDNDVHVDTKSAKNTFVVKVDSDASEHKDADKNEFVFSSNDGGTLLFVVDGKIMKKENTQKLDPNNIKSITVLKDAKAIKKYGRKGKNGVLEIITKKKDK